MGKLLKGKSENIYKLGLHDIYQDDAFEIIRVPGGFLYRYWNYQIGDYYEHITFVPYDNEFIPRKRNYIHPSTKDQPSHTLASLEGLKEENRE